MKSPAVPYGRQWIDEEDVREVVKVLRSHYLTQGPKVREFESAVAKYCGAKFAVSFSSGTAALHGACFTAGIKQDDEVITSPLTFAASANCVLYCGGRPVFADIRTDLPLIDPIEISKKISEKTKAIIPVDYSGIPADYNEIKDIAKKYKLTVIADASHSLGATYKGKKVGTLADMTIFSFHPVKLITTGEGGMVVTNNRNFYEKLILFRTHGIMKDPNKLLNKNVGPWYYEMQELGFNYRLTDMQATLGISQMRKVENFLRRRSQIAQVYTEAFRSNEFIKIISVSADRRSAWHLFPIQVQVKKLHRSRKQIIEELHKASIIVQVHFIPVHLQPYYKKKFKYKEGDFPNSEKFYREEISLPIYPKMTLFQVRYVIEKVKSIVH